MASGVEPRPPGSGDKSLGEIVSDITEKLQLLIREEIELLKAELSSKFKKIGTGAGMASAALITLFFFTFFLFFGIAHLINDLFNWEDNVWAGFLIVAGFFLLLTIILLLVGIRLLRTKPTPEMTIEEAKATQALLEEARS